MLRVVINAEELWDEKKQEFHYPEEVVLDLEHSLLSLSKWEAKHEKPFLTSQKKTGEEVFSYLQCMVVTPNADLDALYGLNQSTINEIQSYIDSSQSATSFGELPERRGPSEVITSEMIYYWMVAFNIPFVPTQEWHLNRLFSLIRIANIKNGKPKKMSRNELAQRYSDLNAQRKAKLGTTG
jgi:hypothetical protein